MSQLTLTHTELAPLNIPDSEILCAIRFDGDVFAGVRVGGASVDRHAWIYGRYGEHKNAPYEGFWAMSEAPFAGSPSHLSVSLAARDDSDEGVWFADNDGLLLLAWHGEEENEVGRFDVRVYNARTGELVISQSTPGRTTPISGEGAGAFAAWVRYSAPAIYAGLPPDFLSVTGIAPTDLRYAWSDERTGAQYMFVPMYGVGALPPPSHPLRAQYDDLLAHGEIIKIGAWVHYLFEPGPDGSAPLKQTEWAMLRLVVRDQNGGGVWPAEHEISPLAAPGPALMKLTNGALVPHALRGGLRSIGALKNIDGHLFIGAMEAGENGRYAAIIETPSLSAPSEDARGQVTTSRRWCECALLNETVHDIARFPDREGGAIFGVSSCELFERVEDEDGSRLIGSDPGGRSLVVARPTSGRQSLHRAVEVDFATNDKFWPAYGLVVTRDADGIQRTGPGVAALYNSVLWEWDGRVWGITSADPDLWASGQHERALEYQSLCWFDGHAWHKAARWPKTKFFLSRGGACGARMLLFGRRELDKRPVAFRYDGQSLESDIDFPYYVERCDTTMSADGTRETLLLSCVKADPDASDNTVLDGFYLVETTGEIEGGSKRVCAFWNEEISTFRMTRNAFAAAGGDPAQIASFFAWRAQSGVDGGGQWIASATRPATASYLETIVGPSLISLVLNGLKPYSILLWDLLCFDIGTDGKIDGPHITPSCTNARCVFDKMPEGTRVYLARYSGREAGLESPLLRFAVTSELTNGNALDGIYPFLWARADLDPSLPIGTIAFPDASQLSVMEQFNVRVRAGAMTSLPAPARRWLDVLVLLPPGAEWDTVIQPL